MGYLNQVSEPRSGVITPDQPGFAFDSTSEEYAASGLIAQVAVWDPCARLMGALFS